MRAPGETLLNYKETNMHRPQTHHLDSAGLLNRTVQTAPTARRKPVATPLRSPHRPAPTCSLCLHSYMTHDYTKHGRVAKPFSQHRGGTGEARLTSQWMNFLKKIWFSCSFMISETKMKFTATGIITKIRKKWGSGWWNLGHSLS